MFSVGAETVPRSSRNVLCNKKPLTGVGHLNRCQMIQLPDESHRCYNNIYRLKSQYKRTCYYNPFCVFTCLDSTTCWRMLHSVRSYRQLFSASVFAAPLCLGGSVSQIWWVWIKEKALDFIQFNSQKEKSHIDTWYLCDGHEIKNWCFVKFLILKKAIQMDPLHISYQNYHSHQCR